jgi:hypothetical protein
MQWTIAFVFACKQSLRWKTDCNELLPLLGPDDTRRLNGATHMPVYCMERISDCIGEALNKRIIDTQTA